MTTRFLTAVGAQWAGVLYAALLGVGFNFALGRTLGPAGFGDYSYILTLASLFAIVQDGGFSTLLFRETAKSGLADAPGVPPLLPTALGHVAATTALGLALVLVLPLEFKTATGFAVLYYAAFTLAAFVSAALKGRNNFASEAFWRAAYRTLAVGAVIAALHLIEAHPAVVFPAYLAGQALALALPCAKAVRIRPLFRLHKGVYAACGSFLLINAATVVYFRCDILLLQHLSPGRDDVGNYSAAYRLIEGVVLLATPLAHIFFRKLRVSLNDRAAFRRSFLIMSAVMAGLGILSSAGGLLLGPRLLVLAFGEAFARAVPLLVWLLPSLLFILPNYILTQGLVALERERWYAVVAILAALTNIGLNLLLIPDMGPKGAALATIATEGLLCAGLGLSFLLRGFAPGGRNLSQAE